MENTEKLIKDQLESLPPEVRESLARVPWQERVKDIAKRSNLDAEKSKVLEMETLFVLYGFEPADNYVGNITRELAIGDEEAEGIAKLVFDEIFSDIESQFELIEATSKPVAPTIPKPSINKISITEEKLGDVVVAPEVQADELLLTPPQTHYVGGKDPYRESIE